MAKVVQLLNQGIEVYPRTLDRCILVSGTTLLSTKIEEIDSTFDGIKDATIPVGKSISAVTDSEGNNITTTYSTKSELSAHTSNTVIHVTQSDRDYWDAKSEFSGSYNDLTDKPTKLSDFTDDVVAGNYLPIHATADRAVADEDGSAITTTYVKVLTLGEPNGVATLDGSGKVPSSQLPAYVDDVLEFEDLEHFPVSGQSGIIYIALDTNLTYRWSGTQYVEISKSLALGETSSTAYAGDKGKAVTDNFNAHSGNTTVHITALEREQWNGAVASGHTHDNKSVLDTISSSDTANWNDAFSKEHVHDNKAVLDDITSADTANWDDAFSKEHVHDNKAVLDTITSSDTANWNDAFSKEHEHSNKTVLDAISSSDTQSWDMAASEAHTHANKSVLDGITAEKVASWDAKPDTDTTYQFEQSGNTLLVGTDGGEKVPVYSANTDTYDILTAQEIETGTDTQGKVISAAVLSSVYNISGDTINIAGESMTFSSITETQIRALFQ